MKGKLISGAVLLVSMAFAMPALAGRPAHRMSNQQHRIYKGVKNGQLTRKEAAHLEHKQAQTARVEARMRARHHGHLTKMDKMRLQHRQNRTSRQIFRKKHNLRHR